MCYYRFKYIFRPILNSRSILSVYNCVFAYAHFMLIEAMRQWQFPCSSPPIFHHLFFPFMHFPPFVMSTVKSAPWKGGKSWTISQEEPKTFISMSWPEKCGLGSVVEWRVYILKCEKNWKVMKSSSLIYRINETVIKQIIKLNSFRFYTCNKTFEHELVHLQCIRYWFLSA